MRELVQYTLDDGTPIVVEIDEPQAERGLARAAARDGVVAESGKRFNEVTQIVRPAAEALISRVRDLADAPDEVGVEFGLKLTFQAGAVIASSAAEGNFRIVLGWKRNAQRV